MPPPAARPAPQLLVVASDGTWTSRQLPDTGALTLGRGPEADIRVNEPSVSRLHARLEVIGAGQYRLTDLDSANGTMVGTDLVRSTGVMLRPGQPVLLGQTVVVVQASEPSSAAAPAVAPARARSPAAAPVRGAHMVALDELIAKTAPTMINVLLKGETGVGKDVVAERLHRLSTRASGSFIRLNCAGLSAELLESELFGHARGAFTGAVSLKQGLLEIASGGTVLLDEIGEMPAAVQAKLLLAIEQRVARRIGATSDFRFDVRFLCATHRDLDADIRRDRFRADFYYRINGITITIPPLRERREEIDALVEQFARDAVARLQRDQIPVFEVEALGRLHEHDWPGNIRELRNVVERAVLLADEGRVTRRVLAAAGLSETPDAARAPGGVELLHDEIDERERIRSALDACGGNQSRAAQVLGISRNTLIARISRYGLTRPRAR